MLTEEEAQARAHNCARDGNLIEAGWILMVLSGMPDGLPEQDLTPLRAAFFAGAKHMLAVMSGAQRRDNLDTQKVANDLRAELARFRDEIGPKDGLKGHH
jgi:hypothetical protein